MNHFRRVPLLKQILCSKMPWPHHRDMPTCTCGCIIHTPALPMRPRHRLLLQGLLARRPSGDSSDWLLPLCSGLLLENAEFAGTRVTLGNKRQQQKTTIKCLLLGFQKLKQAFFSRQNKEIGPCCVLGTQQTCLRIILVCEGVISGLTLAKNMWGGGRPAFLS